jgi:hypothetical protein
MHYSIGCSDLAWPVGSFCKALTEFTDWLANAFQPWLAYQALMAGQLKVTLDKCPGIWSIGLGKTWRRAIAKTLLLVAGSEAKRRIDQLCAGLEAGIKGSIHAMTADAMMQLWELHQQEEEWGFPIIDAKNACNEQNWTGMLWTVWHVWPSGARFVFKCYRHWATLVLHSNNGTVAFLYSKECVTQGDPLSLGWFGNPRFHCVRSPKLL